MPVRSTRRRYLWLNINTSALLTSDNLNDLLERKIIFLYGVIGDVKIGYRLIEFNPEEKNAIIRCNHDKLNDMRATIAQISKFDGNPIRIDVILVSGTIKSLRNKMKIRKPQ